MSPGRYVQTFTAVVRDEDCDALGHMNVQHYFRAVSEGMFVMMEKLGLSRDEIARRRLSFAVVHAETDFRREVHAGEAIALESSIRQVGDKVVVFHHRLFVQPAAEPAMTTEYRCVMLDLDRRRAVALPDDIRAAAAAHLST
jgi:YbgC/YbaW family acyl-CoA thioester hydrolase